MSEDNMIHIYKDSDGLCILLDERGKCSAHITEKGLLGIDADCRDNSEIYLEGGDWGSEYSIPICTTVELRQVLLELCAKQIEKKERKRR